MQRRTILFLGVCLLFVGCDEQATDKPLPPPETEQAAPQPEAAEVTPDYLSSKETQELVKGHRGGEQATNKLSQPDETEQATPAPEVVEVTADLLSWNEAKELVKSHKGKVVVLDIWSTACPPCMIEFPGLVDLHHKHKADVRCISISLDFMGFTDKPSEEVQQRVLAFLKKKKATFQNVICTDPDEDVYELDEFNSLPAVYVFDREGNLKKLFSHALDEFSDEGFTYAEHITPLVEELLAENVK